MTQPTTYDYQHLAVREFMERGRQSCPPTPTIPSLEVRKFRASIILEEALETIWEGLGLSVLVRDAANGRWIALETKESADDGTRGIGGSVAAFTTTGKEPDLIKLADGCADLKVVTVGTEIACGINGQPVFEEVMRSNMTKDFSGTLRADGKILKGENYEPPNLEAILKSQGME